MAMKMMVELLSEGDDTQELALSVLIVPPVVQDSVILPCLA